jgi:hypothetical protein
VKEPDRPATEEQIAQRFNELSSDEQFKIKHVNAIIERQKIENSV